MRHLGKCSNLRIVNLSSSNHFTDKGLQYIGQSCAEIEELHITECTKVTDAGLAHLAKVFTGICGQLSLYRDVQS